MWRLAGGKGDRGNEIGYEKQRPRQKSRFRRVTGGNATPAMDKGEGAGAEESRCNVVVTPVGGGEGRRG